MVKSSLDELIQGIEKDIGDVVYNPNEPIEVISTGSLSLDWALGCGGFPKGRIIDIFGPQASGKSLMTLLCAKVIQKLKDPNQTVCYIDAERAFNPGWAKTVGVDPEKMLIVQPDTGEEAFEVIIKCCESGKVPLVIVDSVPALVPAAAIEREIADGQKIGDLAALMSWGIKKILPIVSKSKTVVIFINQMRAIIGNMYGKPEEATGGMALKFYASVRLEVNVIGGSKIMDKDVIKGHRIRVKVVKNKVGQPFKHAEFNLYFESGVDTQEELADLAFESGIIKLAGAGWFEYEGKKKQGRDALIEMLKDKTIADKLRGDINDRLKATSVQQISVD